MCRRPACSAFGSRATRQLLVKVPDDRIDDLVDTLRPALRAEFANIRSYRSNEDQIGRNFDRAENYLSLVGLIIVILGGIAVSSVTRVFILQKIRSIAVLKCVGARSREVIAIYILQVMALGLAGSLLGVVLARLAVGAIPLALGSSSSLLAEAHYGVTWSAALQGIGIGVLVSLLFSIVPLLHVRFIKPSLLLRDESTSRPRDLVGLAAIGGVAAALVALTVWQAGIAAESALSSARALPAWRSCCTGPAARWSPVSRRWRNRRRSRCATPCCTCRVRATRRA